MKKIILLLLVVFSTTLLSQNCYEPLKDKTIKTKLILSDDYVFYIFKENGFRAHFGFAWEPLKDDGKVYKIQENEWSYKIENNDLVNIRTGQYGFRYAQMIKRECSPEDLRIYKELFEYAQLFEEKE